MDRPSSEPGRRLRITGGSAMSFLPFKGLKERVQIKFIAPRCQARKERLFLISPNLGALCAFARVAVFPIPISSHQNFNCFWLAFKNDSEEQWPKIYK
jgi:hypothetical protein